MSAADLIVTDVSWAPRKGDDLLLHPTSLAVTAGQVLGIVGPNGAGKSTLLRILYRFQAPLTGQVLVDGQDIWTMTAGMAARRIAAVLQDHPLAFGLTVQEVVMLGRTPHRSGFSNATAHDIAIVEAAIARLDLHTFADREISTLSGGERQRVMVARALAQEPQVLVLDEPTNHLDIRHQLEILALIRDLDMTIIVSLHDLNMAHSVCDAVLLLEEGYMRGFGPPDEVLSELLVSKTFRVDARREKLTQSGAKHFSFHLPL